MFATTGSIDVYEPDSAPYAIPAGSTENRLYVFFKDVDPENALMTETLFELSCGGADRLLTKQDITLGIWDVFDDIDVKRKDMDGGNNLDGTPLVYWGPNADPMIALDESAGTTVNGLLSAGWGRCGAWARLFRECLTLQDLNEDGRRVGVAPGSAAAPNLPETQSAIREWDIGNPSYPVGFFNRKIYKWSSADISPDVNGFLHGQNNPAPRKTFNGHCIYRCDSLGAFLDPSYGIRQPNEQKYVDASLALIGYEVATEQWVYRMPWPTWNENVQFIDQVDP